MSFWKKLLRVKESPKAGTAKRETTQPSATSNPQPPSITEALKAAGYETPQRPTSPDAIVDLVTQSMLARQTCLDKGTFETGEKNPQQILCSDNACPCSDGQALVIGRTAYLYISQAVVDFRKDCRTLLERDIMLEKAAKRLGAALLVADGGVANPFYLCETGAKLRGLDLLVALADAKTVSETGFAPLRPTPKQRALG